MAISRQVTEPQRMQMVAEAAYLRTERRGFNGGDRVADWLEAEAEIDRRLRERGHEGLPASSMSGSRYRMLKPPPKGKRPVNTVFPRLCA